MISSYREKRGISQNELAALVGVTQSAVAKWETGDSMPRADKLCQLAEILNCTVDDLLREQEGEGEIL